MPRKNSKPRTKLQYTIGRGFHVKKADAEALFTVIRDVFKGEKPSEDELVKEARKKRSPIHGLFEWDDPTAAKQARHLLAQYYLRAINVVVINVDTSEVIKQPVRAFVPVRIEGRHRIDSYIPVQRLHDQNKRFERKSVLERAKADFESWLRRYERYVEFLDTFDPIIQAFRKAQKRIDAATKNEKVA